MKVEIELADLENLRSELKRVREENQHMLIQSQKSDPQKIEIRIRREAIAMANDYLTELFKKLGFTDTTYPFVYDDPTIGTGDVSLKRFEGVNAYLGVRITNEFRQAFISLTAMKD